MGVNLGDDQRDVLFLTKRAGVVDHDAAGVDNRLAELPGDTRACAEQGDVDALEAFRRHLLDGELGAFDRDRSACGARGGQSLDLGCREIPLLEHLEHLTADDAGGTGNGDDRICGHFFVPRHSGPLADVVVRLVNAR